MDIQFRTMQLKKEDILKIISEQHSEVDEMASRAEHGYDTKGRSEQDIIKDKNGVTIGFKQIDYKGQEPRKMPIIRVCGGRDEIQRIMTEHPEIIAQLKEEFGAIPVKWAQAKKPASSYCLPPRSKEDTLHPLPGEEVDDQGNPVLPYIANTSKPIEKPKDLSTKLKEAINATVEEQVGQENQEATDRLRACSVPVIYGRDIKHINRHSSFTNETLKYQTHNFNIYTNIDEFMKSAYANAIGDKPEINYFEKHMRYRYNEKNSKWSPIRAVNITDYGQKTKHKGKTDVYNLDKGDFFSESEEATSSFSELTIEGKLDYTNHTYEWNVIFDIKFGEALMEVSKSWDHDLLPVKTLKAETTIDIGNQTFNENYTVLDSRVIMQGLIEVLSDLRQQFEIELDPFEAISLPNLPQSRIDAPNEELRESMVDKIMNKIMKQK
jgi:hypothetical protein